MATHKRQKLKMFCFACGTVFVTSQLPVVLARLVRRCWMGDNSPTWILRAR